MLSTGINDNIEIREKKSNIGDNIEINEKIKKANNDNYIEIGGSSRWKRLEISQRKIAPDGKRNNNPQLSMHEKEDENFFETKKANNGDYLKISNKELSTGINDNIEIKKANNGNYSEISVKTESINQEEDENFFKISEEEISQDISQCTGQGGRRC